MIVRDTSVAVSMARSAMPGWIVGWGVSVFTSRYSRSYGPGSAAGHAQGDGARRGRHLWLSARARFEQRVKDLWLSATGAVLNGG